MNQKQIDAKVAELSKLTEAKQTQKEAEKLQIRKSRNDTHSKIKSLEREMKEAEASGEVDNYIKVAADLNAANTFLKILEQREADLEVAKNEEIKQLENLANEIVNIRGEINADVVKKLDPIADQILKIIGEADNTFETAKNAAIDYGNICHAPALSGYVLPLPSATTYISGFYSAAKSLKDNKEKENFEILTGIKRS